jgi:mono/diheme cytochrome c family protein
MKLKFLSLAVFSLLLFSCGGEKKKDQPKSVEETKQEVKKEKANSETSSTKIDINASYPDNKGIGPVKSVKLGKIDEKLVAKGKELYKANCTACHKIKKKYIGPGLKGVTQRRSPEWIMNMIMNSKEMLEKDPIAKALIAEYNAPMAQQQLKEEEVRAILEYLRTKN